MPSHPCRNPNVQRDLLKPPGLIPGSQDLRDLVLEGVCEQDEVDGDVCEDEGGLEHDQHFLQPGLGATGHEGQVDGVVVVHGLGTAECWW